MAIQKKYKQKFIPNITTPKHLVNAKVSELKKFIKDHYSKNLTGAVVINNSLGHTITFSSQGKQKLVNGSAIYLKKVAVITGLKLIIANAEFSNWGNRKENDPKEMLGYYNLKCKVLIDNKLEHLRIAVMVFKNGKIYFNHEVNKIRL
jgi:hypothetical protein